MSAMHSHCKVFAPDGKSVVVSTGNPVGVEGYVRGAIDFANWAFKTPAQRSDEIRMQVG
jgi:hypothetical protein